MTSAALAGRHTWFVLALSLLSVAAVPAFWYLADHSVLPWKPAETRWTRLRAHPKPGARDVSPDDFILLIRRGCSDSCPDYQVTLYASGRVEYVGKMYVCETGPRTSVVDANAAARLIADLRDGGFFEGPWISTDEFPGAPVVSMQLSIGGKQEWIRDYHGDLSAPSGIGNSVCPDGREVGG